VPRHGALADPAFEPAEAVALSARLLETDPLDEAALRQHMSALARDGQAGAARAAYGNSSSACRRTSA
jgi:DNA-binding SARP family transcriptional activator